MIYRTPEPRLEPSHTLDEYLYHDEYDDGADFIQEPDCIEDLTDEEINEIYKELFG